MKRNNENQKIINREGDNMENLTLDERLRKTIVESVKEIMFALNYTESVAMEFDIENMTDIIESHTNNLDLFKQAEIKIIMCANNDEGKCFTTFCKTHTSYEDIGINENDIVWTSVDGFKA
jgi:hypothetical protein